MIIEAFSFLDALAEEKKKSMHAIPLSLNEKVLKLMVSNVAMILAPSLSRQNDCFLCTGFIETPGSISCSFSVNL